MKLLGAIFFILGMVFLLAGASIIYIFYNELNGLQGLELLGPSIFAFIGFVFATIGGGILLVQRREKMRGDLLMRTGRRIKANITDIAINTRIRVNHRHPYIITCSATVSGKEREFKSKNVYGSPLINKGDTLNVYLDFRNYDNYWVEVPKDATRS